MDLREYLLKQRQDMWPFALRELRDIRLVVLVVLVALLVPLSHAVEEG
jgi:hypothetical protein